MKFGKEEIQKLVLGGLMLVGLVYCYFSMLLAPLDHSQEVAKKKIDEVHAKLTEAKAQIARTKKLETDAPQHALAIKQLTALIPDGSPIAWFPIRVTEFFKQYGLDKTVTRVNGEMPEKEIPGFRQMSWGIEIPKAAFAPMGQALAEFENEELLAEVSGVQIELTREDPEAQRVLLTVTNLVKQ